jgi:multidrug efflux pump subunit AcrA (membrane-fusion protein)
MTIARGSPASDLPGPAEPFEEDGLARSAATSVRRLFRLAILVTVGLIGGVGGWASLSSISGAVVATGQVAVDGKRKAVQHLDGGTIARIHVRDGARVEEGAVLVTLDARELEGEKAALEREIEARSRQVALIESDLVGLLELQAKKLVANSRVTSLQRDAAGIAADLARLGTQKAKVDARLERIAIHAPVAGFVHNLLTNTVGGVIAPGATIAEIVPSGNDLVIEAKLAPGDIDQVRPGLKASVRLTSFNQRSTPSIEGTVDLVSADLMRDEAKGIQFYLARISLAAGELHRLGGKALVPGMPADVMIETDRRSVMTYLTKPLSDQIARAFREE